MSSLFSAPIAGCTRFNRPAARRPAIICCLCLLLCLPARASNHALTLAESQRLAVAHSRQLTAQDAAIAAAREMAVAAGQRPDPVLKAGIDNVPLAGPDRFSLGADFMTMRRIGVMQEFTGAAKRALRAERYEREAGKAQAQKMAATAAIERDTAIAWLDRFYLESMAGAAGELVSQAALEIDAADSAYRAGRGSQAELFAARSLHAMAQDRASELARRVGNARIMLARWTGAAPDAPLAGRPAIDTIRLDPATLDAHLAHHPLIAVISGEEDIARTEAKLAEAGRKADWSVEVAFQQRGPGYPNMLSVGLSLPLQWDRAHRQDRELGARLARAEQAVAEREEMLRVHVAETSAMIAEWENGRERLARFERELVPLAAQRSEATLAAYRGGKTSLPEVLAARRGETEVRLQALQLQMETARLWAQLNFLFPTGAAGAAHTNEDAS